ncbi:hypothetical protein JCGZ_04337 [Jatropha curcas]|uniref:Dof zinc finger protein n=1 Tax=Jatropha curcas TaxID=180498 RepID=A0A067KQJ6_JATCU|nr:dof zinc finger protein DOF1.6 [Jatropha curcas]KDP38412.1 hypothetical protein JCGZ_04337 [Jatropha curcas]
MPSESGDKRPARSQLQPPKLAEPLPCPRCSSTNTKFCYYNNYNLSQPRHFCKGCRRYWTHGGTLRNVPVGGGTRKNSKRSRPSTCSTSTSSSSTNTSTSTLSTLTHEPDSLPVTTNPDSALPHVLKSENSDNLNLNENLPLPVNENGNFISLLNSQQGPGFMGMVGYGAGFGYGLCEVGVGFGGRGNWSYPGMGYVNGGNGGGMEGGNPGCNTWQVSDVEGGGLVDGECFCWPGLAISTAGKSLK